MKLKNLNVIQIFYCFSLYISLREILYSWSDNYIFNDYVEPIWVISILNGLGLKYFFGISLLLQPLSAALSLCFLNKRWPRVIFALSFFINLALHLSDGREDIGFHLWLWVSIYFSLMPLTNKEEENEVIKGARFIISLPYFFSGIQKVFTGAFLNFDTFPQQMLGRAVKGYSLHPVGWSLLEIPVILGLLYFLGALFQSLQIFILLKPRLSFYHGLGLFLFHILTFVTLDILFPDFIWLILVFFIFPFLLSRDEQKYAT